MPTFRQTTVFVVLAAAASAQATWTRMYPTTAPSRRYDAALTYHPGRDQVVLFGGRDYTTNTARNDLWGWTGSQWQSIATTGTPSARSSMGIASDPLRGRIVLFGGYDATNNPLNDTWELVGTQWTAKNPVHRPTARLSFAMACDEQRSRTVVFGGYADSITYFADTWEWDGTDWQQQVTSGGPMARAGHQMAFDAAHGVLMMYGGNLYIPNGSSQVAGDTWTWDGTSWTYQQAPNSPAPSAHHRFAYDHARARLVGYGFTYYQPDPFAWEWDGTTWRIVLQASPGPFNSVPLAYDRGRRQVVAYGYQYQPYANHGDTWVYATATPATATAYGSGCAGSAGVPVLANAPFSLPWLGDLFRTNVTNLGAASQAVVFTTGVAATAPQDLTSLGMPGCSSYVATVAVDFAAVVGGAAQWSLVVPNSTVFAGLHLYQQAAVLDPPANAAGAVVTNALELGTGIR